MMLSLNQSSELVVKSLLEKIELIEKKMDELLAKPKPVKNQWTNIVVIIRIREAYMLNLITRIFSFQNKETLEYYEIKFDDQERAY